MAYGHGLVADGDDVGDAELIADGRIAFLIHLLCSVNKYIGSYQA